MRDRDQVFMCRKVRKAQRRQPALLCPEHLAAAAQPQILLRDAEPIVSLAQDRDALARHGAEWTLVEQQTGRGLAATADPAAQLVKLGEAKALGVLDHHDGCLR